MTRFAILYVGLGVLLALICDRRSNEAHLASRLGAACLCCVVWPLWAPVAFLADPPAPPDQHPGTSRLYSSVRQALTEARRAIAGSPLDSLLPEPLVAQVLASVLRIETRANELRALLERPDYATDADSGTIGPTWKDAGVQRLHQLLARDEQMLNELSTLSEALCLQLLLARYSGESANGVRDLVTELGAQVESLDEWFTLGHDHLQHAT